MNNLPIISFIQQYEEITYKIKENFIEYTLNKDNLHIRNITRRNTDYLFSPAVRRLIARQRLNYFLYVTNFLSPMEPFRYASDLSEEATNRSESLFYCVVHTRIAHNCFYRPNFRADIILYLCLIFTSNIVAKLKYKQYSYPLISEDVHIMHL